MMLKPSRADRTDQIGGQWLAKVNTGDGRAARLAGWGYVHMLLRHKLDGIFIIGLAMQFTARRLLVSPTPLFEEEGHVIPSTNRVNFLYPSFFHWP